MDFPRQHNSERRPSIKAMLTEESRLAVLQSLRLSQQDILESQRRIASLPCTWITDAENVLKVHRGGWRSFTSIIETYPHDYASMAICLALALRHANRKLMALYDIPQGAVIEAKLAGDFWSWPGRLRFGIFDQSASFTYVIATAEIKGQLYDWGKGRRVLEQVMWETERLLRTLTTAQG